VAHKSDRAWEGFMKMVEDKPFSLGKGQKKGLTVGRFLSSHEWNNKKVLSECFTIYRDNANHLVP